MSRATAFRSAGARLLEFAALSVVVLCLASCSVAAPDASATSGSAALPDGVSVEIVQLRADVAPRQAQVRIVNASDEAFSVGDVRVQDPRFDGVAERVVADRTSTVAPGRSVDVRVQLPPAECGSQSEAVPSDALPTVVMIEAASGNEVAVEASDPLGFLAPLHTRECLAAQLANSVDVAFTDFVPSEAGEPATLTLAITPTGGGATLVGVQRTNLLDFGAATVNGAFPIDLAIHAGDPATAVDLPLVPFRCDPHAVQEDKRGTIFDVRVEIDGHADEIELFVGEQMRGRILNWVAEWCDFAGS